MTVGPGKKYYICENNDGLIFEAIVTVQRRTSEINKRKYVCSTHFEIRNDPHWVKNNITIRESSFKKEVPDINNIAELLL